ncbi:signal transduction histidine kinase [Thermanaerovibrio velox DSM 12556]|uniref:histidine kinase n=1 Tax=Thermanaerovibrio velox DSM 12556 TaxID=926567 RepID=H0UQ97_9BACT|nr:histidine kinase [Thermanaerovibrio velox]EHM10735.1 signal transduction histidine kinase [Thermanaerovibrio velox DSM 12556]
MFRTFRRPLLPILFGLMFLMSASVVGAAFVGFVKARDALESVSRSYVMSLSYGVAERVRFALADPFRVHRGPMGFMGMRRLIRDLTVPGIVAVVDYQGQVLAGSPGSEGLVELWVKGLPVGQAVEARDSSGERYTVAVTPVDGGVFVIAAVPWGQLMGPMVRFSQLWPVIMVFLGLMGLGGMFLMGRWVVAPLRRLSQEVLSLRLGEEVPSVGPSGGVWEIEELKSAIRGLAEEAVRASALDRSYVNDLIRVQEEEKERVSREIHDGPLQTVTALMQRIRLAMRFIDDVPRAAEELRRAEEAARECVRELRELCDHLAPPWVELGNEQALQELALRLRSQWGVEIQLDVHGLEKLGEDKTLPLMRIVQEAVNNGCRHGGARSFKIGTFEENGVFCFYIRDDGSGFVPPKEFKSLRVSGHRGLANMMERAALMGAELQVISSPGGGCEVRCLFGV